MLRHPIVCCLLFISWFQVSCVADDPALIVANVQQGDACVTVSCKLEHKQWTIGQPLSFQTEVENRGTADVRVFDPKHDVRLKMNSMRVIQLEILDEKQRRIGDLFAPEGGSDIPPFEKFWLLLPPGEICQSKFRGYGAGYVPHTRFSKGRELPPGTYYLRVVVMSSFFLSNHQQDPESKRRLAESEPFRIELLARPEQTLSAVGK